MKKFNAWRQHDDYSKLLKNVSSLTLVQLSNYILPLITLPYLARILGPNFFGLVMMAQATMIYLTLLTDYGFNLSATKEIAKHQNSIDVIERLFSSIMAIKTGLLTIGALVLYGLTLSIPIFKDHQLLFWASYLIVIGNTFLPTFLFQGLEKMSNIAVLNLIAKVSFTVLIFLIITSSQDYIWVHALWGLSYIMVDIAAFIIIKYQLKIKWVKPQINQLKKIINISFEYFLSRIAIAIYLNTNVIVVGVLLAPTQAGIYGGAEKLLFAITTFYAPLIETIYPYLSRTKNKSFIKKILTGSVTINTIGCIGAFFLAPWLVPFILGTEFKAAIGLFQWMLIIAFLHLPSSMIGYPVLAALGYVKTANRSVILGAILHIVMILVFYTKLSSPLHFIWIMIVSQSLILSIRLIKCVQVKALS
ncbi:MAG: oligosaccharide flippase family protein [Candidatus Margulisiibacteriota bacterium]